MTDTVPSATEYEPEPIEEDADQENLAPPAKPPESAGDPSI